MDKFTDGKYNVGVNHEHVFLALMRLNKIKLNNLNIKNRASSVAFQLSNSNIHIELKYRQLSSNDYNTTLFDNTKVDIWLSSEKLSEARIYVCFGFTDGKHYIIKCNKEFVDSFDTKYILKWKSTNYLIPLGQCISLADFVDVIKLISPCY